MTGELNLTALKAISVGDSGLTAAQRTSASASLDACLASDMKLPTSPPDQDMEILIKESKLYCDILYLCFFFIYITASQV